MPKFAAILFVLIFCAGFQAPVLAADQTISGSISDVDWVSSSVSVHYFNPYSGNSDEIILKKTSDSQIFRGTTSISFSDIQQGDPVTITYYDDGLSGLKIIRLSDLNRGSG
ncbi:MAG: hypothetical protein M0Q96_05110 [Candidatus Omnitrophica bacterium]|jgi:hypothetical protein|nr:hypothetical protein [Candidatus Omnitrophota bacterium]